MSMTIPAHLAPLASLTGGGVIFTFDEDLLTATSRTIADFVGRATPIAATADTAAIRYASATAGAAGDAFTDHWNTLTPGHVGTLITTATSLATALDIAAHAITVVKVAVLGYLSWGAARLAAALTGPGRGGRLRPSDPAHPNPERHRHPQIPHPPDPHPHPRPTPPHPHPQRHAQPHLPFSAPPPISP